MESVRDAQQKPTPHSHTEIEHTAGLLVCIAPGQRIPLVWMSHGQTKNCLRM